MSGIESQPKCQTLMILILSLVVGLSSSHYCMNYAPLCECKSSEKIECRNVRDLSRLSFRSRAEIADYKRIEYMRIEAGGGVGVVLDSSLQLDGLMFDPQRFQLILANFVGIELETQSLFSRSQLAAAPTGLLNKLVLSNFTLKFFYRGEANFNWICDLIVGDRHLRPLFSLFK